MKIQLGWPSRPLASGGTSESGRDCYVRTCSKILQERKAEDMSLSFCKLCCSNVFKTDAETKNLEPINMVSLWTFLLVKELKAYYSQSSSLFETEAPRSWSKCPDDGQYADRWLKRTPASASSPM